MNNFAEFNIPINLLFEAALEAEGLLEDLQGQQDNDVTPVLEQEQEPGAGSDEESESDSLGSSSEDGEIEEDESPDTEKIVVLQLYNELYEDLNKMKCQLEHLRKQFEERRTQHYAANFDRTKKRPISMKMVIDRHQKVSAQLKKLDSHLLQIKRQIKAWDRHDTQLFYPTNYHAFREKTYATFVQPAREIPLHSEGNHSVCVCCSGPANVSIHRACLWCEGHACSCRQFIMCEKCSSKWYWRNSENFNKSFATCPLCRAEYCLEDIVVYKFTDVNKELTLDQQIDSNLPTRLTKDFFSKINLYKRESSFPSNLLLQKLH
jgi:hypothetical protein